MITLQTAHTIIVLAGLAVMIAGLLYLKQKLRKWGRAGCRASE